MSEKTVQQRQGQVNFDQQQMSVKLKDECSEKNNSCDNVAKDKDNESNIVPNEEECIFNGTNDNNRKQEHLVNEPRNLELSTTLRTTNNICTNDVNHEHENDDWEKMFDDSGEYLDEKVHKLTINMEENLNIETPSYNPKPSRSSKTSNSTGKEEAEFSHVLEVSNFPVEFRTQDLLMIFSQYKESGFDIKWVDDTHALLVFSSSRIAKEALNNGHSLVILKPLTNATLESQLKAKKYASYMQPYRPRPETCAALARRLVTGALGLRLKTTEIERENEKRILAEARERKLQAIKQQQRFDNWDS